MGNTELYVPTSISGEEQINQTEMWNTELDVPKSISIDGNPDPSITMTNGNASVQDDSQE